MVRRVTRITGGERAMQELSQLLGDTHAHPDHGTAGAERRYHRVSSLQRQAATDGNRFLPLARKGLRRNLPLMLPAEQSFFETPRHEHVIVEAPLDAAISLMIVERFRQCHDSLLNID